MKFNEKLLKLRKEKGLSQEELGMEMEVSRQLHLYCILFTRNPIYFGAYINRKFLCVLERCLNKNDKRKYTKEDCLKDSSLFVSIN